MTIKRSGKTSATTVIEDEKAVQAEDETPEASAVTVTKDNTPKFTKEQVLSSYMYSHKRDALSFLLKGDKMYTHADIKTIIEDFMKGKVK